MVIFGEFLSVLKTQKSCVMNTADLHDVLILSDFGPYKRGEKYVFGYITTEPHENKKKISLYETESDVELDKAVHHIMEIF